MDTVVQLLIDRLDRLEANAEARFNRMETKIDNMVVEVTTVKTESKGSSKFIALVGGAIAVFTSIASAVVVTMLSK